MTALTLLAASRTCRLVTDAFKVKIEPSFDEEQAFVIEYGVLKAMLIDSGSFGEEGALIKIKPGISFVNSISILVP